MKHVAVLGAGRIGRIHATNLAAQPGVKLKYVCDAVPAAAAAIASAADLDSGVAHTEALDARAGPGGLRVPAGAAAG